jgi:hypothetical protein
MDFAENQETGALVYPKRSACLAPSGQQHPCSLTIDPSVACLSKDPPIGSWGGTT